MRRFLYGPGVVAAALAAGCSSVDVPAETFYRLEVPAVAAPDPQQGGVLRVMDLQLATALAADCLLRLDGVRLSPRPLARWVAPLDRLVTDALVLGLSRARVCELVKGSGDPGAETWTLRGRLVDFVEVAAAGAPRARVTLELWLTDGDRVLFHDEFTADEPMAAPADEAAVQALSKGISHIVAGVVARMRERDLFAQARAAAAPSSATASPAR